MDPAPSLQRTVAPGIDRDAHRAIARIDPDDMDALGVVPGGPIWVEGRRRALARAMPTRMQDRGAHLVQLGPTLQRNARVSPGDLATVRRAEVSPAERVELAPRGEDLGERDLGALGPALHGAPVRSGDVLTVSLFDAHVRTLEVRSTDPDGAPVSIGPHTILEVAPARAALEPERGAEGAPGRPAGPPPGYAQIGGIGPQLDKIRETIELPLRYPEVFARLGIGAPQGILLYGPPGCGKTLTARTIAAACDASFHSVSGPEVIQKFYGESEAALRGVFERAQKQAPAIIFLDEIDSLAPRREDAAGDVERRVVATLLTLMDGLSKRGQVVVIGATNRPNAIDPALRRPGRFDREIAIPVPDRRGRLEILEIHSRDMPLAPGVSLEHLADTTHGYVGADLEALCREAAMASVRRALPSLDSGAPVNPDDLTNLRVRAEDFLDALRQITPSATREVFVEVPDVRWDDVGGLGSTKDQLVEAVEWPLRYADLFRVARVRPSRGILLCGPPGVGKTLLAKAAATEIRANFISVKGPALMDKFVGESERNVREIFQKARQASPCIIFFDEIDALAPPRSQGANDSNVSTRVLAQLLTEMDGVEELEGVLVLAATNRPDMIDEALLRPGRFDEIIEISAPSERDRAEIFAVHLRDKPLADDVDPDALARAAEGLVGSEIAEVCRRAAIQAMRGLISASERAVDLDPARLLVSRFQLLRAIEDVRSRLDR